MYIEQKATQRIAKYTIKIARSYLHGCSFQLNSFEQQVFNRQSNNPEIVK